MNVAEMEFNLAITWICIHTRYGLHNGARHLFRHGHLNSKINVVAKNTYVAIGTWSFAKLF